LVFVFAPAGLAQAALPSFDEFFREVSVCSLDMERYDALVPLNRDGVLISLPSAGAVRGLLINAFYFARGAAQGAEQYGLLINAPLEAVTKAFPEFAARNTVNGHLRRLTRLSEQTGERGTERQTLLMCVAGTAV
jgi:hypothetical protein